MMDGGVARWLAVAGFCLVSLTVPVRGALDSRQRGDLLRTLAKEALAEMGAETLETTIQREVLAEFANRVEAPTPPEKDRITMEICRRKADAMLQEEAEERFPMPPQAELEQAAAEEYPMHEIGDAVSIRYQPNPIRTTRVSGVYQGREGDRIKIGAQSIMIRDIEAVPGNEDELLKFFPEKAKEKREQFIAKRRGAVFARRDQWKRERHDEVFRTVLAKQEEVNESRGYILHRNEWRTPGAVLAEILPDLRAEALERERRERELAAADDPHTNADDADAGAGTDDNHDAPPEPADGDATANDGGEDALDTPPDGTAPDAVPDGDPVEATGGEGQADGDAAPSEPEDGTAADAMEEDEGELSAPGVSDEAEGESAEAVTDLPVLPIAGIAALGLAAMGAVLCWPPAKRGTFYPGQGGAATVDPLARFGGCPHVIARFPSRERALSVLAGVSCLSMSHKPGAELSSHRNLEFGFAPEQEGTLLGFIAGAGLTYPLWRGARDLIQRSRDCELLSAESPTVDVRIPESEAVSELGQFEGDETDPSCYWVFQAETREAARAFLKQVRVNTDGWHVVVQTPQGHWARDIRGPYEE